MSLLAGRIAYHNDGTIALAYAPNWDRVESGYYQETIAPVLTEVCPPAMHALNSIDGSFAWFRAWRARAEGRSITFVFPGATHLTGIFNAFRVSDGIQYPTGDLNESAPHGVSLSVSYSEDSLTGLDGSWKSGPSIPASEFPPRDMGTTPNPNPTSSPHGIDMVTRTSTYPGYPQYFKDTYVSGGVYRNSRYWQSYPEFLPYINQEFEDGYGVYPLDLHDVKAIKLTFPHPVYPPPGYNGDTADYDANLSGNVFFYGRPEEEAQSDYLRIRTTTVEGEVTPGELDLGDIDLWSSEDFEIRVQNMSPVHTASDVSISIDPGHDIVPNRSRVRFLFSWDGEVWDANMRLPDLSPGAVTAVIRVRRVLGATSFRGADEALISASVGRWY